MGKWGVEKGGRGGWARLSRADTAPGLEGEKVHPTADYPFCDSYNKNVKKTTSGNYSDFLGAL